MNRFLAAALLCIMQLCYAHCFAEQVGLVPDEAARCCETQPSSSGSESSCKLCEVFQTGGMDVQKRSFAVSNSWTRVDSLAIKLITAPVNLVIYEIVPPTPSDGVPRTSQSWEMWCCKALPVRGPSLILA